MTQVALNAPPFRSTKAKIACLSAQAGNEAHAPSWVNERDVVVTRCLDEPNEASAMERLAAIVNYAGLTPLEFARFPLREEGSTEETMMLACRCEPMSARWYSVLSEKEQALILANKILERHGFDPDDELVVIATQFLRERG